MTVNFTLILKNVSIADAARENVLSAQYRNIRMVIKSISEAAFGKSKTTQLLKSMVKKGVVIVEGKGKGTK